MTTNKLKKIRSQIDEIDQNLQQLINQRAKLAIAVSQEKIKNNPNTKHFYRPEREAEIFERIKTLNQGPLSNEKILLIFREIMSACLALESPLKVSYLGPIGTFTQQAAFKHFGQSIDAQAVPTIEGVFKSLELSNADFGVVPVENSYEGSVGATLDCLQKSPLKICGEVQININHHLMVKESDTSIETIYAHPQSFAQCKSFLAENYPSIKKENVSSNALGAQMATKMPNSAAIAPEVAASIYQLEIIHQAIQDSSKNSTRFLVIGKYLCEPSNEDKTSLLFSAKHRPGSLYSMLKPFETYQINMSKLESRPSKVDQWDYVFFIDVDCHQEDENFKRAIKEVEKTNHYVRILGSYPKRLD